MIHGSAVILWVKEQVGTNPFGEPIYDHVAKVVDDVLIGLPSAQERIDELNLSGRMIEYTLGIPKGNTDVWEDQIVEFFGHKFRTFGIPEVGIEENIPLRWHKKVKCERYE
jgi:hypothetical protein